MLSMRLKATSSTKTAEKYKITNVEQLKDPKIAKLFDSNGNGKADLTDVTQVGAVKQPSITI